MKKRQGSREQGARGIEQEAGSREQGAGSREQGAERGFDTSTQLLERLCSTAVTDEVIFPCPPVEIRLAYFPQLSRYIPLVELNAHD
ncbi:hypothetical protein CDG76_20630 [Nostoc sp. 'Peltigera membranacea cyanobiont' 210A]|nr:hypothetical protein CDG76_20630 [Nostoc sp. 'Peltigera membranacea cyanobiont' 210A]